MKRPQAPEIFQKPIASLDLTGLPPRDAPEFADAVITRYALEYASKGWNAAVTVDDEFVRVVAIPENGIHPKQYVLGLLKHHYLDDALPLLEALYGMLDDAEIAYNYGICLSELGRIAESVAPLRRCVALDREYTNAFVGLGVAYSRLGQAEDAERALVEALHLDPKNAYAKRNLAAVLGRSGRNDEALPLFREVAALMPQDPGALLGLAQCLEALGGDHRTESNQLYGEIVRRFGNHPVVAIAEKARNRIASEQLHAAVDGKPRMDAVFYMQGAMDTFAKRAPAEVAKVVMEIAQLGQSGLQINQPEVRYSLKTLPGEFSGLQLVSIMHVGIRQLDAKADPGTGLDREYETALAMRAKP